ncbi:MAG: hypothetical protein N4A57_17205 [Anaeromicrobium sp.]|jgi:ATP-dependent Lon protease|uniref:hypothetical protein n=1 Tax=Anaeromicrobium sp. TaxID=1929132 RepID=UPI0025F27313|nr:hypothetical protein [Anaeromicrobium sp.]MCT4595987.1 hypothetical protein [Anaeromicrobium sp.]
MLRNKIEEEVKKRIETRETNYYLDEHNQKKLASDLAVEYKDESNHEYGELLEFILELIVGIL